jgi:hypothetical protein
MVGTLRKVARRHNCQAFGVLGIGERDAAELRQLTAALVYGIQL